MVAIHIDRAQTILEATTDGYWDWNLNTGEVFLSPGWLVTLGYAPDEIMPSNTIWEKWLHPDDYSRIQMALKAHFNAPLASYELEYRMRAKGNHWLWCKAIGKVVERGSNGKPLRMVGTLRDITHRHEQDRVERERGLMAAEIIQSLTLSAVIATDAQGIITTFNSGAERILGMKATEVIGRKRLEEYLAEEELKERSILLSSLTAKRVGGMALLKMFAVRPVIASGRWTILHALGPRIHAQIKFSSLPDAGVVAIIDPIESFSSGGPGPDINRAALDRTPDALALMTPDGKLHYANPAFCDLLGVSPVDSYLNDIFNRMPPGDFETSRQRLQQSLDTPGIPFKGINRIRLANGTWRWLEIVFTNLVDDPLVASVVIALRDITAAIGLTQAIVKNEERFRLASEYTHIGVWDWNISIGDLYWSEEVSRLFGYTDGRTQTTYANFVAAVYPLDRAKVQKAIDDALFKGLPYEVQHRIVRPDGSIRWMQERGDVERDMGGKPIRMIGAVWDITVLFEAQSRLADREEHFRALAEHSSEAVLVMDLQQSIRFASQSIKHVLGIPPESMLGLPIHSWVHPLDVCKFIRTISYLLRSPGGSMKIEVRARGTAEDDWRWFEGTISNLVSNPSVNGFVLNLRDITVTRRAVQELAQSEQRFRNLAEWAPVGIFQSLPDGSQIWSNQAWSQITGLSREQGTGFGWMKTMTANDVYRIRTDIETALRNSSALPSMEYQLERLDGTKVWVASSSAPQFSADEQLEGYLGTIVDISEIKRLARLKDEFISTVNHELRTPLTSIYGALGLVLGDVMGKLPAEIHEVLSIAAKNTARLMRMVNDFLNMEKIESGKTGMERTKLDLITLVREAVADSKGYATLYGVELLITSLEDKALVLASHDRIAQVMANLLSNAVKFSPKGHPVEISVASDNAWVRVSIEDQGPGIPAAFRSRLFDRFAQADASDQRQREGTGLGLSISRDIIRLHDGRIGFEDRPQGGTSFYFELPVYSEGQK